MNETIQLVLTAACGGLVMFVGVIIGFVLGIRFDTEAIREVSK